MATTFWFDKTAEAVTDQYNFTAGNDPPAATLGTPKSTPIYYNIGYTIGFSASIVGIIANAVVLTVLSRARRQFGSSVNIKIVHAIAHRKH